MMLLLLLAAAITQTVSGACNCNRYSQCVTDLLEDNLRQAQDCHSRSCKPLLPVELRSALDQCDGVDGLIKELLNLKDEARCLMDQLCKDKRQDDNSLDNLLSRVDREKSKHLSELIVRLNGGRGNANEYVKCMEQRCDRALDIRNVAELCSQGNQCTIDTGMAKMFMSYKGCNINLGSLKRTANDQCQCLKQRIGFTGVC